MKKLTSFLGLGAIIAAFPAFVLAAQDAGDWTIGPWIKGKQYSLGMPADVTPTRDGFAIDFPTSPNSHVHYVTFEPGSLDGASEIVMRYRIEAERGARFVPQEFPEETAKLSLYFQRRGDPWTAKGRYNYYRWYSPVRSMVPLEPGKFEVRIKLRDPEWVSVYGKMVGDNGRLRDEALRDAHRVGFVLGTEWGRGHGVYATRPARMVVTDFEIR